MKKIITQLTLILSFITFGFHSQAQITTTSVSNPSICDGTATLNASMISDTTWNWQQDSATVIQAGGLSIANLCAGNYFLTYIDSTGGAVYIDFTIGTSTPCSSSTLAGTVTTTIDSSVPGCDGTAVLNVSGGVLPYQYVSMDSSSVGPTYSGLCAGTYIFTVYDSLACTITLIGVVGNDSTIVTPGPCATSDLSISITTANVSVAGICDGSIIASISGGTAPYTSQWNTGATSLFLDSVCNDVYTIIVYDANGCEISGTGYVGGMIDSTFSAPLYGYVVPTGVSADGLCNGIASAISYGGVPPYSFLFSDGTTMSNAYNLCAGLQSVTITDAVGDSISLDFIISTPSSVSTTTSYGDSVLVDSVYASAITDCVIDYLIIDSAYIIDYMILPGDSLLVTWGVVYGDTLVTIFDSYVLGTGIGAVAGVYMVFLEIYCPTKTVGHFFTASDQIYYNAAFAGIKENNTKAINLSIYPNPFNEELTISLDQVQKSEVTIADITGKTIVNQNFNTQIIKLDLSRISSGQYIVSIKNDNSISTRKIVKQ